MPTPIKPGTILTGVATAVIAPARFIIPGAGSTDASFKVTAAANATAPILGVCVQVVPTALNADYNDPAAAGDQVSFTMDGIVYLQVDGASPNIPIGGPLTSGAAGVGVLAAADGNWVGAIALEPATADGVLIPVKVANFRLVVPA